MERRAGVEVRALFPAVTGQACQEAGELAGLDEDVDVGADAVCVAQPWEEGGPLEVKQLHARLVCNGLHDRVPEVHPRPEGDEAAPSDAILHGVILPAWCHTIRLLQKRSTRRRAG